MSKNCIICGKEFEINNKHANRQITCSKECRIERDKRYYRNYTKKSKYKSWYDKYIEIKNPNKTKNCIVCNKEFKTRYDKKTTCSKECSKTNKRLKRRKYYVLYNKTPKRKEYNKQYVKTEKRKNWRRKYEKTPKHQLWLKKYKLKNKEKIREYGKKYYYTEKGQKRKEKYKKNKFWITYYSTEKGKNIVKRANKKYMQTPKGKIKGLRGVRKRLYILKKIKETFTPDKLNQKLNESNGICIGYKRESHYVGEDKLTLDHIIPISKAPEGFEYTINDIQLLCKACNTRKKDRVES